jgi:hypothetical protein
MMANTCGAGSISNPAVALCFGASHAIVGALSFPCRLPEQLISSTILLVTVSYVVDIARPVLALVCSIARLIAAVKGKMEKQS